MSEQSWPSRSAGDIPSPLDELIAENGGPTPSFTTAFRGYDKDEVDSTIADLLSRLHTQGQELTAVELRVRQAEEVAGASAERLQEELDAVEGRARDDSERLQAELTAANARADDAEGKVEALTQELIGASGDSSNRVHFEEVLRVAEEQAGQIIKNATVQADRLMESARDEIQGYRTEAQSDAEAIRAQAEHDAQQVRLRIDTELVAHDAQIEREATHAAEKLAQAEQEAAVIRTEAEKGAAALRSLAERETTLLRGEAEDAARELRLRTLEFEESLSRRRDDAQQEFLMLHNQAVAHAERITQDANDQVQASVDHAQRVQVKADDFDRLMRAQARQIEADSHVRSREHLDRAHTRAQKIIDTVTTHSQAILRDAEDRSRQLRWQQHQLTSFMAEVRELIRPEGKAPAGEERSDAASPSESESSEPVSPAAEVADTTDAEITHAETTVSETEEPEPAGDPDFLGDEPLEDENDHVVDVTVHTRRD